MDNKLTYSRDEVAQMLGVSRDSVIRAIAKGHLQVIRFGRRVLVPRHSVEKLISEPTTWQASTKGF
jgi:excisionase family DNA binding protein